MAVHNKYLLMLTITGILAKCTDCLCYLPDQPSKKGNVNTYIAGGGTVPDIDGCKARCDVAPDCKGAEYHNTNVAENCILLNAVPETPYISDSDYTLIITTDCPPTAACSMTSISDTMATGTNIQLQLTTADQCGEVCLFISECSGVVYSSGSCSLYGGTPAEGNSGDALTHVKEICSGKACCMTATSTMKAANAALKTLTSSLESCEEACVTSSNCHSVYFNNNVCFMHREAPTTSTSTGSTYSVKSCTGTPTYEFTLTELCYGSGEGKMTPSILLVSVIGLALNAL